MSKLRASTARVWVSGSILTVAMGLLWWQQFGQAGQFGFKTQSQLEIQSPESVVIQEPFVVTVELDTQGENVNTVGVYLYFEVQYLQLLQLDTQASFCQFYPEKKFDNQLGTVTLVCGAPHPGLNGESQLMSLQFMPTNLGETTLRIGPNSQILVSDGKGTNNLDEFPQTRVKINNGL